ncbi:MAG: hypothetical protein HGB23_10120 [Chlorobiaceae bacterium]|nr:hypothetical protein [Chlorobiaceae bacterium]
MSTKTISTAMARQLAASSAIQGAAIIGQPGGWSVILRVGVKEQLLGTQRTDKPRTWRSLDRCVEHLKNEFQITRIDLLDSTNFSDALIPGGKFRTDAAERLRNVHGAAAHDKWFRQQVELGVLEADDVNTTWISNEDASESWAKRRRELAGSADGSAT